MEDSFMQVNKKSQIPFFILDILKKYSWQNNPIKIVEISKKLNEMDVFCNRKTISSNVNLLISVGVDIEKNDNGIYYAGRLFDEGEIIFLVDSIFSNPSIPYKYADEIIEKLIQELTIEEKRKFTYLYKSNEVVRGNNKQIFYVIDVISNAIYLGKKIAFNYNLYTLKNDLSRRRKDKYIINPYFTISSKGKYFLVGNKDNYNNISNYRIDFITDIEILPSIVKPMKDIVQEEQIFDPVKYANENVYMMNGVSVEVELKLKDEKSASDLIDWYGSSINFENKNEEIIAKFFVNENAIIFWLLQYCESVEIINPPEIRNKLKNIINNLQKKYQQ